MPKKADSSNLKTRPDITDDGEWLAWLNLQPENRGINVVALYRSMIKWCAKKEITPTRRRLLRWIDADRDAIPVTSKPPYNDLAAAGQAADQSEPDVKINCPRCKDVGFIDAYPDEPNVPHADRLCECPDCGGKS